jgi:DtxR family Mn-dependent transcriptional regulator
MTKKTVLGSASEDYLKAIYDLRAEDGVVTTTELAAAMRVSAASTTNMMKKLAALKLVRHSPYYGVELTPAGEKIALEVVRHHRLIEAFLHEALGIPWDEVHAEAHKLEHVLSDKLEDHIADYLGHPTEDPHGDPIPTKAGSIFASSQQSLAELPPGTRATIRRIGAQDPAHLRYLRELGLIPKANVSLIDHAPFQGPVRVRVANGEEHSLDRSLAQQIWVSAPRKRLSKPRKMARR